jgi:hypothetical protein
MMLVNLILRVDHDRAEGAVEKELSKWPEQARGFSRTCSRL